MFANLNQGSLIHVLSLNDGIKYSVGTIEGVQYNTPTFGIQNINSFVTLKVNLNGKSTTIEGVSANSNVSKTSNYIVTDNKETMVEQVESLLQNNKNIVDNIDKYKNGIKDCEEILKQISPRFAKESDRDNAIVNLNNRVDNLDSKLDTILNTLKANNKTE